MTAVARVAAILVVRGRAGGAAIAASLYAIGVAVLACSAFAWLRSGRWRRGLLLSAIRICRIRRVRRILMRTRECIRPARLLRSNGRALRRNGRLVCRLILLRRARGRPYRCGLLQL